MLQNADDILTDTTVRLLREKMHVQVLLLLFLSVKYVDIFIDARSVQRVFDIFPKEILRIYVGKYVPI